MDITNGLYFPIVLTDGAPEYPGLLDSIDASLRHIIAWSYGSRYFVYPFGSLVNTLLQAPASTNSLNLLLVFLKKAIATWEKRIKVTDIGLEAEGENVVITIEATVIAARASYQFQTIL